MLPGEPALAFLLIGLANTCMAGHVTTHIGNGEPGFSDQPVNNPYGLVVGPDGALYFLRPR
jgi:hypothetical protein